MTDMGRVRVQFPPSRASHYLVVIPLLNAKEEKYILIWVQIGLLSVTMLN